MIAAFEREVQAITLSAPKLPIISTVTGRELTAEEAVSPQYWARHAREPVKFSTAVRSAASPKKIILASVSDFMDLKNRSRNALAQA